MADTPLGPARIRNGNESVQVSPPGLDPEKPQMQPNTVSPAHDSPASPILKRTTVMSIAAALCGLIVLANVFNSTLMCDDGYFVHHFPLLLQRNGPGRTVWIIFLNLDIARNEYRLYGLSRLIHLTLWSMFGSHAWAYAGVIGAAQAVSALGIYRVLRRFHADAIQSGAVALA